MKKEPDWDQLSRRIVALLVFLVVILCIPARMPLLGAKALEGVYELLPFAGQPQISAAKNLVAGHLLTAADLDTTWSAFRPDAFTEQEEVEGLYVTQPITKGHTILHSQVARPQVVAKHALERHRQITANDVELALTPYQPLALTDLADFTWHTDCARLYARHAISEGATLLSSAVAREDELEPQPKPQVVAAHDLKAGQQIATEDLTVVYAAQRHDVFSSAEDLLGTILTGDVGAREPLLQSKVNRSQVVALENLAAGAQIAADHVGLTLTLYHEEAFTSVQDVIGQHTRKAISASLAIADSWVDPKYVVAREELKKGEAIADAAVKLAFREGDCAECFTEVAQVVGSRPKESIQADSPIARTNLERLQVVANLGLPAGERLVSEHVRLEWTDYDAQAFTAPDAVTGRWLKRLVPTGHLLGRDDLKLLWVVFPKKHLDANHLIIIDDDLKVLEWDYSDKVFTDLDELKDHYTVRSIEQADENPAPILREYVKPCQVVAAQAIPAYRELTKADLTVDPLGVCEPLLDRDDFADGKLGKHTIKAIDKGAKIEDTDLISIAGNVVVAFAVPPSGALGGKLQPCDTVTMTLVHSATADQPAQPSSEDIGKCVILSVEKIESGQATSGQAAGAGTEVGATAQQVAEEPSYLIVAAIPADKHSQFATWLPFSTVVLTLP